MILSADTTHLLMASEDSDVVGMKASLCSYQPACQLKRLLQKASRWQRPFSGEAPSFAPSSSSVHSNTAARSQWLAGLWVAGLGMAAAMGDKFSIQRAPSRIESFGRNQVDTWAEKAARRSTGAPHIQGPVCDCSNGRQFVIHRLFQPGRRCHPRCTISHHFPEYVHMLVAHSLLSSDQCRT